MKLMYYSPRQVPKETVVFILSCAIISMKMNAGFAESMVVKVMMDKAYCRVCPFTYVTCCRIASHMTPKIPHLRQVFK